MLTRRVLLKMSEATNFSDAENSRSEFFTDKTCQRHNCSMRTSERSELFQIRFCEAKSNLRTERISLASPIAYQNQ